MNNAAVEERLGYRFKDAGLLLRALTRKAYAIESRQKGTDCEDQDAFATLGDSVIRLSLVDLLMRAGASTPDQITRSKRELEREEVLAEIARDLGIGPALRLGAGEEKQGARQQPYVLAESLEAVAGALYLDAGFIPAFAVISRWFEKRVIKALEPVS
jgi:dsRNA-specific ribonuclease